MNYELFMGEALAVARLAAERGAPAVGAIAVMNEAMVARGANRVAEANDPTAHAVVVALREASRKLGTPHLPDVTMFTTHEPCPMCVGALLGSDVAALVFAVPNPIDGAAGTRPPARPASGARPAAAGRVRDPPRRGRGAARVRRGGPDRRLKPFAILSGGEVSEWLMVPLSKSGLRKQRGFESHPLRHSDGQSGPARFGAGPYRFRRRGRLVA